MTGFLESEREVSTEMAPKNRIRNWNESHTPLNEEERKKQDTRCMDYGIPFCQLGIIIKRTVSGCPLNNPISERNDLVYTGNWSQVYNRLKKTNSLPEFTSRVCPVPCGAVRICGLNGDPVTIKEDEWAIIEKAYDQGVACPDPSNIRTDKRVAVVGSGPAGLTVTDQLNKWGHSVAVFERSDRVGGLLMYGIPNMKLEEWTIDRKVDVMKQEGVSFVTGADAGKDYKANRIMKEYDRTILACGASNPKDTDIPGRDAQGIYSAMDSLKATTKGLLDPHLEDGNYIPAKDKHVVVIGGDDTGNDCIGISIRQGCAGVIQLEMVPKPPVKWAEDNTWLEWPRVLKTGYGQGKVVCVFGKDPRIYQTTVEEFVKDAEGRVCKAAIVDLVSEKDEENGRTLMVSVEGSERETQADLVPTAAGFLGSQSYVAGAFGVQPSVRTNVDMKPGPYRTSVDKVFTADDMHRGQSLVVWAIRESHEVARAIGKSLVGYFDLAQDISIYTGGAASSASPPIFGK